MTRTSKTPAGKAGASRDSFAGLSLPLSTPLAIAGQGRQCGERPYYRRKAAWAG